MNDGYILNLIYFGERLDYLMGDNLKSNFFKPAVPGAIDRLCQKITNIERIKNEN